MKTVSLAIFLLATLPCSSICGQEHNHGDETPEQPQGDESVEEHEHHQGHPHHAIALIGVYAAGFPSGESVIHHGGAGVGYHTGLIPKKLELEIAVKAVFSGDHSHFPLEVALKIPFSLSESTFFSLGLGPVVALHLHGDEIGFAFGGGLSAELSHWYSSFGGIVIGSAYELLYHEKLINEFVVVAGPAFGW